MSAAHRNLAARGPCTRPATGGRQGSREVGMQGTGRLTAQGSPGSAWAGAARRRIASCRQSGTVAGGGGQMNATAAQQRCKCGAHAAWSAPRPNRACKQASAAPGCRAQMAAPAASRLQAHGGARPPARPPVSDDAPPNRLTATTHVWPALAVKLVELGVLQGLDQTGIRLQTSRVNTSEVDSIKSEQD